jgi:hypothetical protein
MDLDAIKARAEAATEGPWRADDEHGLMPGAAPAWCVSRSGADGTYLSDVAYTTGTHEQGDAEFIAHARTDIPELVAEVERLRFVLTRTDEADGSVIDILDAERDTLRAQRDAVLGLHKRRPWRVSDGATFGQRDFPDLCDHCHTPWPCATARALGGDGVMAKLTVHDEPRNGTTYWTWDSVNDEAHETYEVLAEGVAL